VTRVIAYIDGFNVYHAIDELGDPKLKWVDLWALSAALIGPGERLDGVKYFSAYATWLAAPYARHRSYVAALRHRGVAAIMGHFKKKPRQCRACGARWEAHEEKESDVHLAVHLVADALKNHFDRALVVSADSDLAPAVKMARAAAPTKKIHVVAPPGRFASARDLNPLFAIGKGKIAQCLLPTEIRDANGRVVATRPAAYDP